MINPLKSQIKINSFRGSLVIPGGRVGVLLIHCLGGNPQELRFVANMLAQQGYTVYCPLLPGLGGCTDIMGLSSWKDWYKAIEIAHDQLKSVCDTVIVGGLSAGAILSLRLARERASDIHGVLLFAPTFWPNGWAIPRSLQLFKLVKTKWFARLFHFQQRAPFGIKDERIRKFVLESFRADELPIEDLFGRGGGLMLEFMRLAKDVRKGLSKIKQDTAIFHPREDDQSDFCNTTLLQTKLGGLVETTVLDDSYHLVTLDRQRAIVADRAVEFTKRVVQKVQEKSALQILALEENSTQDTKVVAE